MPISFRNRNSVIAAPAFSGIEREHARRDVEVTGELADYGHFNTP